MRWTDLAPDPDFLTVLNDTDASAASSGGSAPAPRQVAVDGGREPRHAWSNTFADGCAHMIAEALRQRPEFSGNLVLPKADGPAEQAAFKVGGKQKQIDVAVLSGLFGLRLGISLKGLNFRDRTALNFDKNLTGRTYELQDEVLLIHRHLPMSYLVGLYFMPVAATTDKKSDKSESSFARTVSHLRARLGRLEPLLASQMQRIDMAAVALYVPGDTEKDATGATIYEDTLPRGVVRYFDVERDPPRRGLPKVETTHSLQEFAKAIADRYGQFSGSESITWAEPET